MFLYIIFDVKTQTSLYILLNNPLFLLYFLLQYKKNLNMGGWGGAGIAGSVPS